MTKRELTSLIQRRSIGDQAAAERLSAWADECLAKLFEDADTDASEIDRAHPEVSAGTS